MVLEYIRIAQTCRIVQTKVTLFTAFRLRSLRRYRCCCFPAYPATQEKTSSCSGVSETNISDRWSRQFPPDPISPRHPFLARASQLTLMLKQFLIANWQAFAALLRRRSGGSCHAQREGLICIRVRTELIVCSKSTIIGHAHQYQLVCIDSTQSNVHHHRVRSPFAYLCTCHATSMFCRHRSSGNGVRKIFCCPNLRLIPLSIRWKLLLQHRHTNLSQPLLVGSLMWCRA